MEKPQILVYIEKSLNYSPFDVKWIPRSAKFVSLGSHPRGTGALQVSVCMLIRNIPLIFYIVRYFVLYSGTYQGSF